MEVIGKLVCPAVLPFFQGTDGGGGGGMLRSSIQYKTDARVAQ